LVIGSRYYKGEKRQKKNPRHPVNETEKKYLGGEGNIMKPNARSWDLGWELATGWTPASTSQGGDAKKAMKTKTNARTCKSSGEKKQKRFPRKNSQTPI